VLDKRPAEKQEDLFIGGGLLNESKGLVLHDNYIPGQIEV